MNKLFIIWLFVVPIAIATLFAISYLVGPTVNPSECHERTWNLNPFDTVCEALSDEERR